MADEDNYVDNFVAGDDGTLMAAIEQRKSQVQPLVRPAGGDPIQALRIALSDPPYATKTESVKDASWGVVALAIGAIKDADIEAAVGQLTVNECDILMKYLYRGLGQGNKKSEVYSNLLKWHPAVLKRAGQASIVRAISEVKEGL